VNSCPANYGEISSKVCVNCKSLTPSQLNYNGQCVSSIATPYTITESTYNVAVDCITANKKVYNGACFDTCPTDTAIYDGGNECFDWMAISKYLLNNLIVSSCPTNNYRYY